VTDVVLKCEGVSKRFGYVKALDNVSFELFRGEVLGLVGDNAAGKSTLLKIIAGYYRPDSGRIYLNGSEVKFNSPLEARAAGIEMIYQQLFLAPNLSVVDNMFLGREKKISLFLLNRGYMRRKAREILSTLGGSDIPIDNKVYTLSGGQQQIVAIGRIFASNPKIVLMDEPTAALSARSSQKVVELVEKMKREGVSLIYVSHRLPEVLRVSDRIMLLRRGSKVFIKLTEQVSHDDIIKGMVAE